MRIPLYILEYQYMHRIVVLFLTLTIIPTILHSKPESDPCTDFHGFVCNNKKAEPPKEFKNYHKDIEKDYIKSLVGSLKQDKAIYNKTKQILGKKVLPECNPNSSNEIDSKCLSKIANVYAHEMQNFYFLEDSIFRDVQTERDPLLFNKYQESIHRITEMKISQYPEKIKLVRGRLEEVKTAFRKKIMEEVENPDHQSILIERINAIQFDPNACSEALSPRNTMLAMGYFNPKTDKFTVCPKFYMLENTDAQITFLISHELSHSIDPCRIQKSTAEDSYKPHTRKIDINKEMYAYNDVLKCLTRKDSLNAHSITDSHDDYNLIDEENPYLNKLCFNDQIIEAFPEWMATEITPIVESERQKKLTPLESASQYRATAISLCSFDTHGHFAQQPSVDLKTNSLIAVNPLIRKQMSCGALKNGPVYCKPPSNNSIENPSQIRTESIAK